MKLSLNSIYLFFGLVALCANAQGPNDTSVYYDGTYVADKKNHKSCIPLKNTRGDDVNEVKFDLQVTCNLFKSKNCTGPVEKDKQHVFQPPEPVLASYFGYLNFTGSLQCT